MEKNLQPGRLSKPVSLAVLFMTFPAQSPGIYNTLSPGKSATHRRQRTESTTSRAIENKPILLTQTTQENTSVSGSGMETVFMVLSDTEDGSALLVSGPPAMHKVLTANKIM